MEDNTMNFITKVEQVNADEFLELLVEDTSETKYYILNHDNATLYNPKYITITFIKELVNSDKCVFIKIYKEKVKPPISSCRFTSDGIEFLNIDGDSILKFEN